jgi:hypothetical protein
MASEVEPTFETLKVDNDYEITNNTYPYIIRRKSSGHVVSIWNNGNGYRRINLNQKKYYYHRVIATQFIPNPKHYNEVDHINHNRSDNRIVNLRWCSSSENQRNKTRHNGYNYVYVDRLSDKAITIDTYGNHRMSFYYYDKNNFYYYNGIKYRQLKRCVDKRGAYFVNMCDIGCKNVYVYLNKFKRLYGINE